MKIKEIEKLTDSERAFYDSLATDTDRDIYLCVVHMRNRYERERVDTIGMWLRQATDPRLIEKLENERLSAHHAEEYCSDIL